MKTYLEFKDALLKGVSVYCSNGKGLVVNFFPCFKSSECGLISVCVDFRVVLENETVHSSSSVVTALEAYHTYAALSKM